MLSGLILLQVLTEDLGNAGKFVSNATGIHTLGNVGIGTTTANGAAHSSNTTILNAGIVTAVKYYGDGSQLTGVTGGKFVSDSIGINTVSSVGLGTTAKSGYQLYVEGNARSNWCSYSWSVISNFRW